MKFFETKFEKELKYILNMYDGDKLFATLKKCKGISKRTDVILKKFLNKHHKYLTRRLLTTYKISFQKNRRELFKDYTNTLAIMIKELFQNEKVDWCDVQKIGEGTYSEVYQIGNKILKIGNPRETYEIPNHRRILQPLIRVNFIDDKNNNEVLACVEITNKVKPIKQMSSKKIYEIYKELREDGIIWTDARVDNLGMLIKPNYQTLGGKRVKVGKRAVRIY